MHWNDEESDGEYTNVNMDREMYLKVGWSWLFSRFFYSSLYYLHVSSHDFLNFKPSCQWPLWWLWYVFLQTTLPHPDQAKFFKKILVHSIRFQTCFHDN